MSSPGPSQESRFAGDPAELVGEVPALPPGWHVDTPDGTRDGDDVRRLLALLRAHEEAGRGRAGAEQRDVLLEVGDPGLRTRENLVVRDAAGVVQAWASVHDRSVGRMLLVHVVDRDLDDDLAHACSDVLVGWALHQAVEVGRARGVAVQTVDTGAFAGDERHADLLRRAGFEHVRTWWQQSRPVSAEEADLVPDPERWEDRGVVYRLVSRESGGSGGDDDRPAPSPLPEVGDLRAVHDVLEESFTDHFGSSAETFDEWLFRQRETPGHRWDQWWLAELSPEGPGGDPVPAGALIGTVGDTGAYVSYVGVVAAARGRGVAKGLLRTIIADAARRGRDAVGLEVDADSSTGADRLYASLGWETGYATESWHLEVPVSPSS